LVIVIGTGKAAGHFAATEGEVLSARFSVLPSDQLTAPLGSSAGIAPGVKEMAIATHDASITEQEHARCAALLPSRISTVIV
jgi:hypothetical protein